MSSIRKLKRRVMARLSDPIVELRVPGAVGAYLHSLTDVQRNQWVRKAVRQYVKRRGAA